MGPCNALHVQNFEALKRDLDKTKDDAEIVKKERDRYHQTILKESKQPREMGKERERGGEADDSMSPSTFPSDTGAYSAQHPFTQERMHGEIVELRKEKRELTQALKDAHNKTKILQYELSDAYGQKSLQRKAVAGSSSSTSLLDLDEIKLKYYTAREQTVLQRQQITSFEVKNTALEKKVERLEAKVEGLEEAKKALFQEYQFDKEQLHLLRSKRHQAATLKESRNPRAAAQVPWRGCATAVTY